MRDTSCENAVRNMYGGSSSISWSVRWEYPIQAKEFEKILRAIQYADFKQQLIQKSQTYTFLSSRLSSLKRNLLLECMWKICITQGVCLSWDCLLEPMTSLPHSDWWHYPFCSSQSCPLPG
jgi:hypothetical protein